MEREVRRFDIKNVSYEANEDENKTRVIRGIIPYDSKSVNMGGMYEVISSTAFNKTLSDKAEIRALVNHDETKILGSTKSGTLKLTSTDRGLESEVTLPNTTYANDVWEIVKRGDCTTLSFGFMPIKHIDNGNIRTLKEVKLLEVSYAVPYPAYPATSSKTFLRNFVEEKELSYDKLDGVFSKIIEEKKLENEDRDLIGKFIAQLKPFSPVEEKKEVVVENTAPINTDEDKQKLLFNLEIEKLL